MSVADLGKQVRDQRLALITAELRDRIRPVCPEMVDELFFEMIDGMAAVQLKYELLDKTPRQ
jgi:hypothetical protein